MLLRLLKNRLNHRYSLPVLFPLLLAACGSQPPLEGEGEPALPVGGGESGRPARPVPNPPATSRWNGGREASIRVVRKKAGGTIGSTGNAGMPSGGTAPTPALSPAPIASGPNGGGFYKDDGLPDQVPSGLAGLPDAQPRREPLHRFANQPYTALGKTYVPFTGLRPYKAQGRASWYGKKFHGQKTSTGETYNMFAMTAAHTLLAIPSYVRVTNLENGRSVVVRVTDRGPFHADRIIDLSYAAALKLGVLAKGSAMVEVESILPAATGLALPEDDDSRERGIVIPGFEAEVEEAKRGAQSRPAATPPVSAPVTAAAILPVVQVARERKPSPSGDADTSARMVAEPPLRGIFLQFGAFANPENANALKVRLEQSLDWLTEPFSIHNQGGVARVQAGPYASRDLAERIAERVRQSTGSKPGIAIR